VSELLVELEEAAGAGPRASFGGDTADLLAFLSFAAAERYGSTHPLSTLARLLRREHGVDTRPFWEFDAAEPEDEEDRAALARLWQAGEPLAAAATAAAAALRGDSRLAALARDFPGLPARLEELAAIARAAAASGKRLRLTYRLRTN